LSDFPHIGEPQRQPDGTYAVTVDRAPNDSREMSYPGKGEAERGIQALRLAQDLLTAVPVAKPKSGRKPKLNEETQEVVFSAIRSGLTQKDAATLADVHEGTLTMWLRKGARAKSGRYRAFFLGITRARIEGKQELVDGIREAGRKDWRARAWLLERQHAAEYSRQVMVQADLQVQVAPQRESMRGLMAPALPPGNGGAIEAHAVPSKGNGHG
jgi:transposase